MLNSIRSAFYAAARLLGWVNAVSRGPDAIVRRVVRVGLLRAIGRIIGRI